MDPRANIEEQRKLAQSILEDGDTGHDGERLAELVMALDEWRRKGGFDPY